MHAKRIAQGAVYGWRARLVDRVAQPVARRTGVSVSDVRTIVGALLLLSSLRRIVRAVRAGGQA